jgi:hypothetical protein
MEYLTPTNDLEKYGFPNVLVHKNNYKKTSNYKERFHQSICDGLKISTSTIINYENDFDIDYIDGNTNKEFTCKSFTILIHKESNIKFLIGNTCCENIVPYMKERIFKIDNDQIIDLRKKIGIKFKLNTFTWDTKILSSRIYSKYPKRLREQLKKYQFSGKCKKCSSKVVNYNLFCGKC